MSTKRLLLISALCCLTFSLKAHAETVLTISSWAPPTHGVNALLWPELIKRIENATDGRVTAKIKYKLGSPPAQYDLIQDGAADITWIFHGYTPGRFVTTKLVELPGYTGTAEAASVAYWRMYQKYMLPANEHRGVKVIALMTHGTGHLHANKKVETLNQIKGMKLRLGGGVSTDVGKALGAIGINVPAPKVYETLASNAADGVMMPMEGKKSFKLTEVARHTYYMPGGFYRGSFALIMNPERFDSLSQQDQAALNEVFGEALSRMAGNVWDQIDKHAHTAIADNSDTNSIFIATEADQIAYKALTQSIIRKVKSEILAKGLNAEAAYHYLRTEMPKL